jgi:hypothetical protein
MAVLRGKKLPAVQANGLVYCLGDGTNPLGIIRIADGKNNEFKSGSMPGLF